MSATLYDKALVDKLQNWIKDDSIKITSPNETRRLFELRADQNDDKPIQLPLIALRRDPTIEIENISKKPLSFDGWRKNNSAVKKDGNKIEYWGDQLNAIPIKLSYQIDIYTRYEEEAEEYVRNFIFNLINFPKVNISIPYNNLDMIHSSNIKIVPEIVNNSNIPERLVPGEFTRYTISIYIDDAYMWDYRIREDAKLEYSMQVELKKKEGE